MMEQKTVNRKHSEAKAYRIQENKRDEFEQIELGTRFTLGRPVSGHYKYLTITPNIHRASISKLLPLSYLERKMVTTRGILKLGRDRILICLTRTDDKPFYGKVHRIYADLINSLKAKEIIRL